jgi:hypothetical protein
MLEQQIYTARTLKGDSFIFSAYSFHGPDGALSRARSLLKAKSVENDRLVIIVADDGDCLDCTDLD